MPYYAHIRQDENGETIYQTVAEHLTGTAALCREFAADFGAEADGDLMGLAHDLGKCTDAFQKRLLEGGPVVDHTTAGMLTCIKMKRPSAAACVAITTEADAEKKNTEMGRKYIVPYGLYRAEGYVSANLARKTTGFSEEDLELLWTAILNMFENDHSAARGKMAVRELIVFKHNCELGCAPAHKLFDLVKVEHKDGVTAPRSYGDYTVSVDETHLPSGVTCTRMG